MIEIGKAKSQRYHIYVEKEEIKGRTPTLTIQDNTNQFDESRIQRFLEKMFGQIEQAFSSEEALEKIKTKRIVTPWVWTDLKIKKLRWLVNEGLTPKKISKELDVTERAVRNAIRRHTTISADVTEATPSKHVVNRHRASPEPLEKTFKLIKDYIKHSKEPVTWKDIEREFPKCIGKTRQLIADMLYKKHYKISIWKDGRFYYFANSKKVPTSCAVKTDEKWKKVKGEWKKTNGKNGYSKKSEFFQFVSERTKELMANGDKDYIKSRVIAVKEWNDRKKQTKAENPQNTIEQPTQLANVLKVITDGFSITEDDMLQYLWNTVGQGEMNMCDIKDMSERHYIELTRKIIMNATKIENLMGLGGHFKIVNSKLTYEN